MTACSRSELLSVHRFCPRCNRIPAYIFLKLGCTIDEAHTLDPRDLLDRSSHDPEVTQRLRLNPSLRTRLFEAHEQVQFMMAKSSDALTSTQATSNTDRERIRMTMESHIQSAIQALHTVLRELLTGSPSEHVELAHSARLFLNPQTGEWTCGACDTTWSQPEIARIGEVSRVKCDLLVPLWNTLWTEKDDFRKSEVFRTNEELTRYMEKEAEKLLFIHESYKSDMRGIRERLVSAGTDASSAREKLEATLDGLQSLDLMTHERAKEILTKLERASDVTPETAKREAEKNESLLGSFPRQQQAARPMAVDPISFFFSPSELFEPISSEHQQIPALTERASTDRARHVTRPPLSGPLTSTTKSSKGG